MLPRKRQVHSRSFAHILTEGVYQALSWETHCIGLLAVAAQEHPEGWAWAVELETKF